MHPRKLPPMRDAVTPPKPERSAPVGARPVNVPCVLIVRDGWGRNPHPEHDAFNAVKLAKTPVAAALERDWPSTLIRTSGEDVGLPTGPDGPTMGNSEVGHQNIGAGRIVDQESVRITKEIRGGQFFSNVELNAAVTNSLEKGSNLHLFGIVSDAGVHGLLEHLYGCLELCKRRGLSRVFLHAFTEGRDTPPNSGLATLPAPLAVSRRPTAFARSSD